MAFSRTSVALLCVCIGLLLLVDVSAVQEQQQLQKTDNAGSTTQEFYLRGNTVGAMTQGTPLTEAMTDESFDFVFDYGSTPATANCRPKPCHR